MATAEPTIVTHADAGPSRGQVGTLCLILSEATFFSIFLVAYLFYIGKSTHGPYPADVLEMPILATVCLLSSSVTIVLAVRDLGRGQTAQFATWLFATVVLALVFLGYTANEWAGLIGDHHLTIRTNLFGTTYYSLVGFHAAHVSVGVLIMSLMLGLSVLGHLKVEHAERIELFSWYWHFVDVVWIAVLIVVYVVGT